MKMINKIADYVTVDEVAYYHGVDKRLNEYLEGKDDLSYEYFVNEKVGSRKVHQTIMDVLGDKSKEISVLARNFNHDRNEDRFLKLINGYYIEVLANIAAFFQKDFLPARLDTNLSMLSMLTLAFFGKHEQQLVMRQLKSFLDDRLNQADEKKHPAIKRCFGSSSVLPLAIMLYNNHSDMTPIINDLNGLLDCKQNELKTRVDDNFNPIYMNAYENFLSDDGSVVSSIVHEMGDFHLNRCRKNSKEFYEFDSIEWQYFPVEIICLLVLRMRKNKDISFISHPVIDSFLPYVHTCQKNTLNELSLKIRSELFKRNNYAL